jgi:microcystin-dependent protein
MPVYLWQKLPAPNATADNTINLQAGRSPSAITPADRATLAAIAQWRDDLAGSLVTTGTSNSYQLASNSVFDSATHLNGQEICFVPHVSNTQGSPDVTLTLDSIANVPIRTAPNTPLQSGVLVAGSPFRVTFNQADNAFYLQGFYGNLGVPLGGMIDYIGASSPFSNFVIPIGQAISRTTFASLFGGNPWSIGTTYGVGDGSTTFNLPNLSGRVTAMLDASGTILPGVSAVGALVGSSTVTLTAAEIPSITFSGSASGTLTGSTSNVDISAGSDATGGGSFGFLAVTGGGPASVSVSGTLSASGGSTNTGGAAHPNVQPTFGVNKLLRII